MPSATLYDFRDLDLMLKIAAEGDDEGWVETEALARSFGFERGRDVSTRLSWMRRFGMLEFDDRKRLWRLSEGGERVTKAKLRAAHERALDTMPAEQMVDVMAHVTRRFWNGSPMVAQMLRREFLFGTKPR